MVWHSHGISCVVIWTKNHLNDNPGWETGVVFLLVFVLLSAMAIFFQTRKVFLKRLLFQP